MNRQQMLKQLDALRMAVKKLPAKTTYDVETNSGMTTSPGPFGAIVSEGNGTHTIVIHINGGTQDFAIKGRL